MVQTIIICTWLVIFFQKCMVRLWDLLAFRIENMIIATVAHNLLTDNNVVHFISLRL